MTPSEQKQLDRDRAIARYCQACGAIQPNPGQPKGSGGVEVTLWIIGFFTLLGLIPALIYTVWRRSEKVFPCDHCGAKHTIPASSEEARAHGVYIEQYTQPSK